MLRRNFSKVIRTSPLYRAFGTTLRCGAAQPAAQLELDPTLKALLQDVDISLKNYKGKAVVYKELHVLPPIEEDFREDVQEEPVVIDEDDDLSAQERRKSPAALFGSRSIGTVVLPIELQSAITTLISESDKHRLHEDAKRIFQDPNSGKHGQWSAAFDETYRSHRHAARVGDRDGLAFASVALPSHYSAIMSVLDHTKHRLSPGWTIKRVIDWGAATGSSFWAAIHSFQKSSSPEQTSQRDEATVRGSLISSYLGIDKREGLTSIGKRLLRDIDMGDVTVDWRKFFREKDQIERADGYDTLAISAFKLTSLSTPLARKELVREMWESGAHTIVILDHSTAAGFEAVAQAREQLLKLGRKELEDPTIVGWSIRGCHVVAPCPHDKECPLLHPGSIRLVCGYKQRLQRPPFMRLTKHTKTGYEDVDYSYVVISRGQRPTSANAHIGRMGEIGWQDIQKQIEDNLPVKELQIHEEHSIEKEEGNVNAEDIPPSSDPKTKQELEAALRLEAFDWPRLVFSPLKRSGHIILDGCTKEGQIMRMTIPKSQGKQPFYDARKSDWGDIFPHPPKNPPQVRYQPKRAKREGGTTPTRGQEIGKRQEDRRPKDRLSYKSIADGLGEPKQKKRKRSFRDRMSPVLDED